MRDILFKAKRSADGEWIEGWLSRVDGEYIIEDGHGFGNSVMSETVCQYTGLNDKNGRKVFEASVVRTKRGLGIINYGIGCFSVQDINSKNNPAIDIVLSEEDIEVIGNIFDNPELLEVEK